MSTIRYDQSVQLRLCTVRRPVDSVFELICEEDKADTASRSRSLPKMEDNLFTSPNDKVGEVIRVDNTLIVTR